MTDEGRTDYAHLPTKEEPMEEHKIERAVLAGLNADCFKKEEQATEQSLDELETAC